MRCPRLHFIPIKQHVINKELRGLKTNKNKRNKKFSRVIRNKYPLLQQYKKFNEEFEGFEEKKIYHRNKIARRSYTMKPKTLENDIIESSKNIDSNFENYFKEVSDNMKIILNQLDVTNKTDVWELESDEIADFKFYFYS